MESGRLRQTTRYKLVSQSSRYVFVPLAALAVLVGGCGSDSKEEARSTAQAFLGAESMSTACDLLNPSFRSEVENSTPTGECVDGVEQFGAGDKSAEIGSVEVDGDHASVQVAGSSGLEDLRYEGEVQLIQNHGDWEVIDLNIQTVGG